MGVAKASLEACVRYLAVDLGQKNIRVNAVSAGAINTLAARGVAHFRDLMRITAERSPLKRTVEAEEVGRACLFLASRPLHRHHRRGHVRGRRLQHHRRVK